MARRALIGGNWKLHLGPVEAAAHARAIREALRGRDDVDVVVFPTALAVAAVLDVLRDSRVAVGVQWVAPAASGAHTGTNSAAIARAAGCTWALTGHSEVRRDLGESDARVGASTRAALAAGLLPMVCVGETLEERDAGRLEAVLVRQLAAAFDGLRPDEVATCTLAYEPVWAIGTGRVASPAQAQEAHAVVRRWLQQHHPPFVAAGMRVLYGGSVTPHNAGELLAQPDVDGALVGGASLKVEAFVGIVEAAGPAHG